MIKGVKAYNSDGNPEPIAHGKLLYICPTDLKIHPALELFPLMNSREMAVLREDILEKGKVLQAVQATSNCEVYDGRHRVKLAIELNINQIPVIFDDKSDPIAVAIASCLGRRQLTKAGIALTLFEVNPELISERRGRGRKNQLARRQCTETELHELFDLPSFIGLGNKYKIPSEYFTYLAAIWDSFDDGQWDAFRKKLLADEISLQGAYSGILGRNATKGRPKSVPPPFYLIDEVLVKQLPHRLKAWDKLPQTERDKLVESFCKTLPDLPLEFRQRIGARMLESITPAQ